MRIDFSKYEGAGNDFVVVDDRSGFCRALSASAIARLCDRHYGVGADGLLLLSPAEEGVFRMVYYNSDGSRASFCGNGARCLCAFAAARGVVTPATEFTFSADDGPHTGLVTKLGGRVSIGMRDVASMEAQDDGAWLLNTGVPHYVRFVESLQAVNVRQEGCRIRHADCYSPSGVNVNFAELVGPGRIAVRTYERGVEDETLACGTGITASAIVAGRLYGADTWDVSARGGELSVQYHHTADDRYDQVLLSGPARRVFDGSVEVNLG